MRMKDIIQNKVIYCFTEIKIKEKDDMSYFVSLAQIYLVYHHRTSCFM